MNKNNETSGFVYALKTILKKKDMTQAMLAGRLGISTSRFNNYMSGRNYPSIDLLVAIADNLDVTLDCLLGRQDLGNFEEKTVSDHVDGEHSFSVSLYKSVSDPLKLFQEKTFQYIVLPSAPFLTSSEYLPNIYAIEVTDDSMAPYFIKDDIVYVEKQEITYPTVERLGFNDIFIVRLSEKDTVGLTLRKVVFRSNVCVLLPVNPEYPATTIYIDDDGFSPVAGKPIGLIRNFKNTKSYGNLFL